MTSWRLEDSDEDVGVRNEAAISAPAPAPPSSHTNAGRPAASALTDRYSLWEYVCMFVWTRCCVLYRVTCDVCCVVCCVLCVVCCVLYVCVDTVLCVISCDVCIDFPECRLGTSSAGDNGVWVMTDSPHSCTAQCSNPGSKYVAHLDQSMFK